MTVKQAHFVTFFSPGSFCAEHTTQLIGSWNVEEAKRLARKVKERHAAIPYGFQFTTRSRSADDLDSKVTATSPFYYLGGKVETLAQVKKRATEKERILVSNMECNGWNKIITNDNSWRWTQPLKDTDIVLKWRKPAVRR